MRKGQYAIYNGKEYKLTIDGNDNYIISTINKEFVDDSFNDKHNDGIYSKIVKKKELISSYIINPFGKINGYEVDIIQEKNDKYLISTSDENIAKALNIEKIDEYDFEKWINKDEVQFFERKTILK